MFQYFVRLSELNQIGHYFNKNQLHEQIFFQIVIERHSFFQYQRI